VFCVSGLAWLVWCGGLLWYEEGGEGNRSARPPMALVGRVWWWFAVGDACFVRFAPCGLLNLRRKQLLQKMQ